MNDLPTLDDVRAAHDRIRPHAHRTAVLTCDALDAMTGAQLVWKCENFQKAGAFKFRGACNAVFSLTGEEAARGVVTHSSGNHGGALALAARMRGIPAYIVVPSDAPGVKVRALESYGARITFCEPTLAARETTAAAVLAETGGEFVHPYDDVRVIAGQGTAVLELIEDHPDLDVVTAPVGGGGLLSGTAIAARGVSPNIEVIAGEPATADDAWRSVEAGELLPSVHPDTVADGLRTSLCPRTFRAIREYVSEIIRVDEDEIVAAMRHILERMKILVEPSSAVPLAAILREPARFAGRKVGVILTGGNVDLDRLPW